METTAEPEPPQCRSTITGNNNDFAARERSTSTSNGHRRSLSGSLFSRLSFLRMSQATHVPPDCPDADNDEDDEDDDDLRPSLSSGRAMSAALQQQRRTRRRRGSLRKTALLGTRFESREKKSSRAATLPPPPSRVSSLAAQDNRTTPRGMYDGRSDGDENAWAFTTTAARRKENQALSPSLSARAGNNIPAAAGGETTTDDDDEEMPFPPRLSDNNSNNTNNNATDDTSTNPNEPPAHISSASSTGLQHLPTPSSTADSYYALQPDATYRSIHRPKSPLATHAQDIKSPPQDIVWDYAETEWWGWIILVVTWLVFVVGMGSCFEVWSWAWDVGETPYAPPELEDDPTLPIVGYYPALIILTAVMSWVWVVVAWVGMKYFKHANISGEDI